MGEPDAGVRSALITELRKAFVEIAGKLSPAIPSPQETPKRASVALIVRIQPHPSHLPSKKNKKEGDLADPPITSIKQFFELPWVQHGDPECLFIKRASRKGDRWTAHVAFPGGKRDPEDGGDFEAAVRETWEEVGLDLGADTLNCGKLPDRVITTSWGTQPLMVLCPFVFLHTSHTPPPLHLQPTEVASAHWIPLRTLVSPTFRTVETCDVTDRLTRQLTGTLGRVVRFSLRLALGKMEFAAVRLWPSLSVFSSFGADFLEGSDSAVAGKSARDRPLLLWGLTLGILSDFLDFLPSGNAIELWRYPTFTGWDVRFVVWMMTRNLQRRNRELLKQGPSAAVAAAEPEGMDASIEDEVGEEEEENLDGSYMEIGDENAEKPHPDKDTPGDRVSLESAGWRASSVGVLLDGYYDIVRKAIWVTLCGRMVSGTVVVGYLAWKKWGN